jgi:hypothetical protein
MPMTVSGHNGNNETFIGLSSFVDLSFYDENLNDITIVQSLSPIHIRIERDPNLPTYSYQYVNVTSFDIPQKAFFLPNGLNLTAKDASLHIELKPINVSIGYFILVKFGYTPIVNATYADYDAFEILCPNKIRNESFYMFFQNMTQINGYKGFVGYSLRELNSQELITYCSATIQSQNILPLIQTKVNFTNDFMIRSYSSGCYYYDTNTGKWLSNGMDIYEDTNLENTHCMSTHLTAFAGGLVILPSVINFQYVFANASITYNPLIYSTVLLITCIYILFAIWSRYMDMQDVKKMNLVPLKDNNPNDSYFYELIVFTGNRNESGTHSKVFKLALELNDTIKRFFKEFIFLRYILN